MASNYIWLIDAGHGGMIGNVYTTAPSKMHVFEDGYTTYEGVINRGIADKLLRRLADNGIKYVKIYHHQLDTPLRERVEYADDINASNKNCIFLSIHSNAGGGSGNEIWTSKGQTKSDKVAEIFCNVYKDFFKGFKFRSDQSDGDADKEADFYVLRKTDCPALLVENLFFDNRKEAEYLMSEEGQESFSDCLFKCIMEVEKIKPI